MKSIIICEGNTDSYLLQNLMRNAFGWKMLDKSSFTQNRFNVDFEKAGNAVTISVAGDSSRITDVFSRILAHNLSSSSDEEQYKKIILVTDNDDACTKDKQIAAILSRARAVYGTSLESDAFNLADWNLLTSTNKMGDAVHTDVLLILLPPDGNGALETFLLDSIAKKDLYDGQIVNKCNAFVSTVDDEQKRYLKKARQITKAKFNVYMSIATASVPYKEQESLLKDFPWSESKAVTATFAKLKEL